MACRYRSTLAAAAVLAGVLGAWTPTCAQPADPRMAADVDAAFARMLADPGNPELTFAYATAAARAGNLEGAIASLERMLLADSGLARVRFELGILYYRIESYEAARGYFRTAREGGGLPADLDARAVEFLAEIDRRQSPHRFSGSVTIGARYQSNANSNNNSAFVRIPAIGGLNVTDSGSNRKRDWNALAAVSLLHNYEWEQGSGDSLETALTLYGVRQASVKTVNTTLAEISTGPRLALPAGPFDSASMRPYLLAGFVTLDDNRYYHTGGGGLQLQTAFARAFEWTLGYETRNTNFRTDSTRSTARDEQGQGHAVSTSLTWNVTADDSVTAGLALGRTFARSGYKSSAQVETSFSYARRIEAPFGLGAGPWALGTGVAREIVSYVGGDPNVDRRSRRNDREWRFTVSASVPVTTDLSFVLIGQHQTVRSSYEVNTYRNESLTAGLAWGF
ncbi:MAG: hypothetical protein JNL71_12895 [Rhodospirillales bacterium]|nr:hypothetical protein [Rhodospirillales bacterium]